MFTSTATLLLLGASCISAAPTNLDKRAYPTPPAYPYGIDPTKPFNLTAATTDGESSWQIQNYYQDFLGGILGLRAIPQHTPNTTFPPDRSNFTLQATHYGTQLYAYAEEPCTSAAYCNNTAVQWANNEPTSNQPLTFTDNVPGPTFGGLALYGRYGGSDPVASHEDFIVGAGDLQLNSSWSVCDSPTIQGFQILAYKGTNASCTTVQLLASQD